MAIGFLRKPYWRIDPEADLISVHKHLADSDRKPNTCIDYGKGLKKLAEYLRLRRNLPKKEKELPWEYTIGLLSPELQENASSFLKHCQRAWKMEQRFERGRDMLYRLGIPLRWLAEHAGLKSMADLTPYVWGNLARSSSAIGRETCHHQQRSFRIETVCLFLARIGICDL